MRWLISVALLAASCAWAQPESMDLPALATRPCLDGLDESVSRRSRSSHATAHAVEREREIHRKRCRIESGEGLWKTATGLGAYKLYFADAKEGQAGFFGTMRENARPVTVAFRLKIENRKITEAEVFISRDADAARRLETGMPDAVLQRDCGGRQPEFASGTQHPSPTPAPLVDEERQLVLTAGPDAAAIVAIRNRQIRKSEILTFSTKK